ncbi:hypothetical protein BKA93DRAFT_750681 [Sparassis latifolia]
MSRHYVTAKEESIVAARTPRRRPNSPQFRRNIITLDPLRLTSSDWIELYGLHCQAYDRQYLSFNPASRVWRRLVSSIGQPHAIPLHYHTTSTAQTDPEVDSRSPVSLQSPFPNGTLGFLYYYQDPELHPKLGEVRFRLTPSSDQRRFKYGEDLLLPDGLPWRIPLISIAARQSWVMLRNILLRDGLVTESLLESCVRDGKKMTPRPLVISALGTPFVVDFALGLKRLWVFGDEEAESITFPRWFVEKRPKQPSARPYTGSALCQLELSHLPEHKDKPALLLRVVKVLRPVVCQIPDYDGFIGKPTEGELFCTNSVPKAFVPSNATEEEVVRRLTTARRKVEIPAKPDALLESA